MAELQNSVKSSKIKALIQKIVSGPALKSMSDESIQKLNALLNNSSVQHQFLRTISKRISRQDEVIIRLKCWVLVHLLLTEKTNNETSQQLEKLIEDHQQKLRKKSQDRTLSEMDKYLVKEVELPYLIFLKKLSVWATIRILALDDDPINIAFSQINKIKEIMQMKTIFQHYSCYYSNHEYAFNLFQGCLINIKALWRSVVTKIKKITIESLQKENIQENEFLLIKEAEETQDLLIQFIYVQKFSQKLPKKLRMFQINLLKPEVKKFQNERRRKKSAEITMELIQQKKNRKTSMGTMQSYRSSKKHPQTIETNEQISIKISEPMQETAQSQNSNEEKLNTERQIEILNTIEELQKMLNYCT